MVQDGIYWLRDYPNHEVSRLLRDVMPANYERWCRNAREKIENEERTNNYVLTSSLNEGAKAAQLAVKDAI